MAALKAAPWILKGISALGGVFGKKRKYLSPEMAHKKYGPQALAARTQELQNFILSSPYGQQLLGGAAQSAQQMQSDVASRAAGSGLGPSGGAESGANIFAGGVASGAGNVLRGDVQKSVWQSALPEAQRMLANEQELEMAGIAGRNAEPSTFQKIAAAAGAVGNFVPQPGPSATMVAPAANEGLAPDQPVLPKRIRKPGEEDQYFG
jgi:hypothetical protein